MQFRDIVQIRDLQSDVERAQKNSLTNLILWADFTAVQVHLHFNAQNTDAAPGTIRAPEWKHDVPNFNAKNYITGHV